MYGALLTTLRDPRHSAIKDAGLWFRGLLFLGWRFRCPCCNWPLRAFVDRGGIWSSNADGYCPRCNAKARHRRHCLYLTEHGELFAAPVRLLEVAPWRALARWLNAKSNVTYIGLDRVFTGPHVTLVGDAEALPIEDECCDIVMCIHVLEHVTDDRLAIAELYRVLRPGGKAMVSVPLQFDGPTREDASVTSPAERKLLFGEEEHLRFYGMDLAERLEAAGFDVRLELASEVSPETCERHGLRNDENIFVCQKRVKS